MHNKQLKLIRTALTNTKLKTADADKHKPFVLTVIELNEDTSYPPTLDLDVLDLKMFAFIFSMSVVTLSRH